MDLQQTAYLRLTRTREEVPEGVVSFIQRNFEQFVDYQLLSQALRRLLSLRFHPISWSLFPALRVLCLEGPGLDQEI